MADNTQNQGLQYPVFYKPDKNNPTVYDANGNAITFEQYKQLTGQDNVPNDQVNWQYVQQGNPPPAGMQNFDPTKYGIPSQLWDQLSPADKAFTQSLTGIAQSQFDQGTANVSINQDLLNKALVAAQTDPMIQATYGDAAKTAAQDLAFSLGQINANWNTGNAAQQAALLQQRQALQDQIQSAGQAYSGFRKQAESQLQAQQADVIQSSRSQLQQQLQNLGRSYETQFGSTALGQQPQIAAGGQTYTPLGGITGTQPIAQKQAVESRQQQIYSQEANPLTK